MCFCGYKEEDATHLFLSCWWAQYLWNNMDISFSKDERSHCTRDWLRIVFERKNMMEIKKAMVGVWVIWSNRNAIIHGKDGWCIDQCTHKIHITLEHFTMKNLFRLHTTNTVEQNSTGWINIYCDGAWSNAALEGGCSAVAMSQDCILVRKANFLEVCYSVFEAEVLGILMGLILAKESNWEFVYLHSDCTEAIWAFQNGFSMNIECLEAIREGILILKDNPSWKLCHVYREQNIISDFMAKKSRMDGWPWENNNAIPRVLATVVTHTRRSW